MVTHYGYFVSFRFGREGNLQNKTTFGVFPRLNIGFGLDSEKLIGTEDARLNKPTINVKFRMFDGVGWFPALALGFDGQGYQFNRTTDEYEQREKGLYLVSSTEFLLPSMFLHVGANMFDFEESNPVRGFFGLNYTYEHKIGFMAEYDHATEYDERRINYGAKYFVTPSFSIDVAGRNIPERPGSEGRETERIVKLSYVGTF